MVEIEKGQHIQDILYVIKAIMLASGLKTLKVPKSLLWQPNTDIFISENTLTNEYTIELKNERDDDN